MAVGSNFRADVQVQSTGRAAEDNGKRRLDIIPKLDWNLAITPAVLGLGIIDAPTQNLLHFPLQRWTPEVIPLFRCESIVTISGKKFGIIQKVTTAVMEFATIPLVRFVLTDGRGVGLLAQHYHRHLHRRAGV